MNSKEAQKAQRGTAASKRSAPVLGRSRVGMSRGFATIPSPSSIMDCCGRDRRTPENRRGARTFLPNVMPMLHFLLPLVPSCGRLQFLQR